MLRRLVLVIAAMLASAPAQAAGVFDGRIGNGLECVPFAREMSGINIFGNAWTWWSQAAGRYAEGSRPKPGAVLVFRPHGPMKLGHVAVVSRIVSDRILMVTHANWSRIGGVRGQVERDVTIVDTSLAGNWSRVKVWWNDTRSLGGTAYPIYGFIYGTPAGAGMAAARASPKLVTKSPDIVGAVIDSLGA